MVIESSTGCGCAVAAVAVATDQLPHEASAAAFASWIDALTGRLVTAGLPTDTARDLATTLITLLEGAHVLCRAAASIEPFDRVCRTAMALVPS
ncbi:LmrA/YxaF family transcription factor [Dactylosporangium cerinum]